LNNRKGRASRQVERNEKNKGNISAIPYAGVIQVRFNGYPLRPQSHPCKKLYITINRRIQNQSQEFTFLLRGTLEI
jgi:hypothetical protein